MRELFNRIGGFNENQRVDEDTELSARLIGLEHTPRHSDSPGVLVRRGWQDDTGKSTQLTFSTADERITQCYLRTYSENAELFHNRPHDKIFLIKRYLRRAAKSRGISEPLRHVRDFSPKMRVPDLMMYLLVKKARSGIKHAFGRP